MAQALPFPSDCCTPCSETTTVNVPGTAGAAGAAGDDGIDGVDAYTTVVAPLGVQPAQTANVTISVGSNVWMVPGQIIAIGSAAQFMGYYLVVSLNVDGVQVTITNLRDDTAGVYADNAAAGVAFVAGMKVGPGGQQGPPGGGTIATQDADAVAITGGAVDNCTHANASITSGTITGITDLAVADGGTGASTEANARTNLGVAIGTDVQAYNAILAALVGVASAADRLPYFTAAATMSVATFTAFMRTLTAAATAEAAREILEVLPQYGLIGSLIGADFNVITDQNIAIHSGISSYIIRRIVVTNASVNMNTATGGIYTGAAKSGITIVGNTQSYAALTATAKFIDLTLDTGATGPTLQTQTADPLILSLSVAQGAPATADVYVYGEWLT